MNRHDHGESGRFSKSIFPRGLETEGEPEIFNTLLRVRRVFPVFVVLAAVLLIAEHRLHVLGYLPWLILLACPLMHVFMHHGHGHKGKHTPTEDQGNHDA